MNYNTYQYIYPPRPEQKLPARHLPMFDNGTYIAEPKLDGDCAVVFTNGLQTEIRKRGGEKFSKPIPELEATAESLHKGQGWMVVVGEFMAKGKKSAGNVNFNGNLVLFDILVYNGVHLSEYSFEERHDLLRDLFSTKMDHDDFIEKGNIAKTFVVKALKAGFKEAYDKLESVDMYEGLVLKKSDAKLELGVTEKNNVDTQIKFRKPKKNYQF